MNDKNRISLQYMVLSSCMYSTMPIAFSVGNAVNAPFIFVAIVHFVSIICNFIYLITFHKEKINNDTLKKIFVNLRHPALYWSMASTSSYVLFAISLKYIDEAVAAILIEISPIFLIIIMAKVFHKHNRYSTITTQKWTLLLVAFIGVIFVILSQNGSATNTVNDLTTNPTIIGIGFILAAAVFAAIGIPATQLWGSVISNGAGHKDEIFYTIIAVSIGRTLGAIAFLIAGILVDQSIYKLTPIGIMIAVFYGIFAMGIGSIIRRIAISKTANLGIYGITYITPAISLLWLGLASKIDVQHIEWLLIGTVLIITTNILLARKTAPTTK